MLINKSVKSDAGFSLIELALSISIFAIVATYSHFLLRHIDSVNSQTILQYKLTGKARSLIDEIRLHRFVDQYCSPLCMNLGREYGESEDASAFDDVDDFDGYQESDEQGNLLMVRVSFAGDHFGIPLQDAKLIRVSAQLAYSKVPMLNLQAYKFAGEP